MGTLLNVVDFIVVVLLIAHVSRTVWKGSGSMVLTSFISLAAIVFGIVSFTSYMGLVGVSSSSMQVLLLMVLLGLAGLIRAAWASEPAA